MRGGRSRRSFAGLAALMALAGPGPGLIGCAAGQSAGLGAGARTPGSGGDAVVDERARVQALAEDEVRALDAIAASDARFARRLGGAPDDEKRRAAAMEAIVADDGDTAVQDGAVDVFSFAARARGLGEAATLATRSPAPAGDDAVPGTAIARPRLERELLERTVAEERARLDEERDLPRGASHLLRAVVETWTAPASPEAATSRDRWLARRLDQLRESLASAKLARAALLALDDALDPLDRLVQPGELPESARALTRLRLAIDQAPTTPVEDDASWSRLDARMRAHLGVALAPTELRARLDRAERALRADAVARLARAGIDERAVARAAAELTLSPGVCDARPADSRVRALPPPPERAPICGALRALHGASDDTARAAAVVALHDATVVGLWALALHEAHLGGERATATAHPFFGAPPDREAKWLRYAAARPVAAIGAGLAAEMITRVPSVEARWLALGDAPLDVVEREILAPPPAASPVSLLSASPPRPASPRP